MTTSNPSASKKLVVFGATVLAVVGLSLPKHSYAFGNDGHQIVCAIAYKLLPRAKQRELTRRTRAYRPPSGSRYRYYTQACSFADRARNNARSNRSGWERFGPFEHWHFLNVPRRFDRIDSTYTCDDCILEGLEYHINRSQNDNVAEWRRTEALFFVGHWVGDIHQPLHVSYRDDLGGNNINRIRGGFYYNAHLHQVWDSGIIAKARGSEDWWSYAMTLVDRVESLPTSTREDWANDGHVTWAAESYAITISDDVDYCRWSANECVEEGRTRTLHQDYQTQFQPVIEERLMRAGVRLAALLDAAL